MMSWASPPPKSAEHRAEAAIHRVERGLQQRPRFTVYAADRVLEGLHGSAEVGRLGVEKLLAFLARGELFQGSHVDRAELCDHIGEARDFALQRSRPLAFLQYPRQGGFIGARLAKLLRKLLARDSRRLLLQPELRDAVAQRLELLLAGKPRLFGRTQSAGDFLLAASCSRQALLSRDPRRKSPLKFVAQRLVIQAAQLGLKLLKAPLRILRMLQ